MAVEVGVFAAIILLIFLIIIIFGFTCYMFRNYCLKRLKASRRPKTDQRRDGTADGLDRTYKTTTDDDASMKLHTLDQIFKQEERSSYGRSLNVTPLRFQQQNILNEPPISNVTQSKSAAHPVAQIVSSSTETFKHLKPHSPNKPLTATSNDMDTTKSLPIKEATQ